MDQENSWRDISEDIKNLGKKIQTNTNKDNIVDDLQSSLKATIESSNEIMKSLSELIESSIKDQEIKDDARNLITQISDELRETIKRTKIKISDTINLKDFSLEEE